MDIAREFRRGAVRLHVLHHAAEAEISGVWMSAELAGHGYRISPGTLYPLLHSLEEGGLLVSRSSLENGRILKYYTATERGRAELAAARSALAELAGELLGGDDAIGAAPPLRAPGAPHARGARGGPAGPADPGGPATVDSTPPSPPRARSTG